MTTGDTVPLRDYLDAKFDTVTGQAATISLTLEEIKHRLAAVETQVAITNGQVKSNRSRVDALEKVAQDTSIKPLITAGEGRFLYKVVGLVSAVVMSLWALAWAVWTKVLPAMPRG